MKKDRVFRCTRCDNIVTATYDLIAKDSEDHCPDPKAPGGYWYCNYEELVSKKVKK